MSDVDLYDRRTTPPQWRSWALIGVGNLALYFVACLVVGLTAGHPFWAEGGRWMMFTYTDKGAKRVEAEVMIDGVWSNIDESEIFPTEWGSGLRFERVHDSREHMEIVAASTCLRHPAHPEEVLYKVGRWEKTIGHSEPLGEGQWTLAIRWNCGDQVRLPDGRMLP